VWPCARVRVRVRVRVPKREGMFMKQIVDLDLPVQLKVKLIDGGITTTDRLRVLTVKNFMHAFAISEATLARIDAELIKAGEDPLQSR
jgi:hypothetical protein